MESQVEPMGADAATIFGTTTIVGIIIMVVAPCYGRVPAPTEGGLVSVEPVPAHPRQPVPVPPAWRAPPNTKS